MWGENLETVSTDKSLEIAWRSYADENDLVEGGIAGAMSSMKWERDFLTALVSGHLDIY